jgi:tetratricopeptide (TPR) repeat protein
MSQGKQNNPAPTLTDLMARYLRQQAEAHAAGLAMFDPSGDVMPFEAGPVQPVDPRPAFEAAVAVLPLLGKAKVESLHVPPHWPSLVAAHEPVVAVAFCVGNYPQLLRNLHTVLHQAKLTELRPQGGPATDVPALSEWAKEVATKKQWPQMLLAVGGLRLAKQFDEAAALLKAHAKQVPAEWQAAWANEQAALAWHRGEAEAALKQWQAQAASVPVLFNRGMASLFLGRPTDARAALAEAVAQLPESDGWHHLGRLYLTLAR